MPTGAAVGECPFPHDGGATNGAATANSLAADVVAADVATGAVPAGSRCPVPHVAAAARAGCPVRYRSDDVERSKADLVVRKLLRIRERPTGVSTASAYSTFQRSMLISATRCTLTYVVFPFVFPAVGFATGVGPIIGVGIGTLALVCDTFTIRRFFAIDHKWRWAFSTLAFAIMGLLIVLLVQDLSHIVGNLLG